MHEPVILLDLPLFGEAPVLSIKAMWATLHTAVGLLCLLSGFLNPDNAAGKSAAASSSSPNPQDPEGSARGSKRWQSQSQAHHAMEDGVDDGDNEL